MTAPVFSPIGDTHTIRYWLTTLDTQPHFGISPTYPVAELPFTSVTFSTGFNQPLPFSAVLSIEDEQVLNTNWINATNPGKTFFWVIIDNQLVYGGRILDRHIQYGLGQATITGLDFHSYWTQRLQAKDYSATTQTYGGVSYAWPQVIAGVPSAGGEVAGAPAPLIAWQLLRDAAVVAHSLPNLTVPAHGEGVGTKSDPDYWVSHYDSANFITFAAPLAQQSSVDALLQQFIGMGLDIGVDVVTDVSFDANGNPQATANVCWPRFGLTAAEQTHMQILDLSTVIDLEWHEDATAQATGLVEQTGAGGVQGIAESIDLTAISTYNYPLVEQSISHTSTSPTALSAHVLNTLLKGDRDLYAYPQLTVVATVPVFNHGTGFSLTALPMGDDIGLFNPFERQGIGGLPSIPFPPKGSPAADMIMRVVRADVTIADEGVSTMQLTLNEPPGNPSPPGYNTG